MNAEEIAAVDAELDALLASRKQAKAKRRDPLDDVWDEAQRAPYVPQIWTPVASVLLIHEQHCTVCESVSQLAVGWTTEHSHATDRSARRLVAGPRNTALPQRIERMRVADVDICPACAESQLVIEAWLSGGGDDA